MSRRTRRIFGLGGPAVALALSLSTIAAPTGAATAPTALSGWFSHESAGMNRILNAYTAIIAKASNEKNSTLHTQCKSMAKTATTLLHTSAAPNKAIEKQWKGGLTQLAGAGHKCQSAQTYAAGLSIGKQLDKGIEDILAAIHGLDQAGVALAPVTPALTRISNEVAALAASTTTTQP